jgi:hypothetical protein
MEKEKSNKPEFFYYPKEHITDYGFETIQDFMLSWTFRWADKKYADVDPEIHDYSKKIIFGLIFGNQPTNFDKNINLELSESLSNDFEVQRVAVHRQWKQIDLIVEIEFFMNNELFNYLLNIENKWYTDISYGQLERAKKRVTEEYSPNWIIKNFVIYCDNCKITENLREQCKKDNFILISIDDLKRIAEMDTDKATLTSADLFNEYWLEELYK